MIELFMQSFNSVGVNHGIVFFLFFFFQGDPGVPGFKGEAGPKGEPVSISFVK